MASKIWQALPGQQRHLPNARGLHSSTSQLNLSRFRHLNSMDHQAYPTKVA